MQLRVKPYPKEIRIKDIGFCYFTPHAAFLIIASGSPLIESWVLKVLFYPPLHSHRKVHFSSTDLNLYRIIRYSFDSFNV